MKGSKVRPGDVIDLYFFNYSLALACFSPSIQIFLFIYIHATICFRSIFV